MPKAPRVAKTKNGFAPKICEQCHLPFEWRSKWRNNFATVKYCSERCRREAAVARRSENS